MNLFIPTCLFLITALFVWLRRLESKWNEKYVWVPRGYRGHGEWKIRADLTGERVERVERVEPNMATTSRGPTNKAWRSIDIY